MNINTNQIVSISEANQNFSRVARIVDKNGEAPGRRPSGPATRYPQQGFDHRSTERQTGLQGLYHFRCNGYDRCFLPLPH